MIIDFIIKTTFGVDLAIGFRKAFLNEKTGRECRDPKKIAIKYLKFYFWVDLLSGVPIDVITDNPILRLITLVKVLRLNRFKKFIQFLNID